MKPLDHHFEGTPPEPASPESARLQLASSGPPQSELPLTDPVPEESSRPGLGIARVLLLFVVYSTITAALTIVIDLLTSSKNGGSQGPVAIAVAWVIALWIAARWSHVSFGQACRLKHFPLRIVPALILASFGFAIVLNELAAWIPGSEVLNNIMRGLSETGGWTWAIAGVVIAPLAEEIFFRGLILTGFLERYSVRKAIWASAILFAVYHMNPWQGVPALVLGLSFAWLVLRTGSTLPGMISHLVFNVSAFYLLRPIGVALGGNFTDPDRIDHLPLSMVGIGTIVAAIGAIVLWRQLRGPHSVPL